MQRQGVRTPLARPVPFGAAFGKAEGVARSTAEGHQTILLGRVLGEYSTTLTLSRRSGKTFREGSRRQWVSKSFEH